MGQIRDIFLFFNRIKWVLRRKHRRGKKGVALPTRSLFGGWRWLAQASWLLTGAMILMLVPLNFMALAQGSNPGPSYDFQDVFFAFIILGCLLLMGRWIRQNIPLLQTLYLPSSIVTGLLALLLGPAVLGAIAGEGSFLSTGIFSQPVLDVWGRIPGVFINVVFATIFLGEFIPSPRDIWRLASPQVAFGQSIAWGQYVVGLLLALTVLTPVFGLNPISGALIEIGFEGGHGTAAGMAESLSKLGFAEGPDLALGLATVGIVSGVVTGVMLANWGRSKGHISVTEEDNLEQEQPRESHEESPEMRTKRATMLSSLLIDPLSLHFGFIALAIALGWLMQQGLNFIESAIWNQGGEGLEILSAIPLFPLALVGGIIVQLFLERWGLTYLIDRRLMNHIGGLALDVTIVAALASISLAVLVGNFGAFLLLSVAGITWNILCFIYLAPRIIPTYWFERGIGDVGQSMGVTATGLLLMQMVDPQKRSGAFESFAYKQLFFEPIVGGGLFTAAAPTLIDQFGPIPVLLLTLALLAFWLIFGFWNYRQIKRMGSGGS